MKEVKFRAWDVVGNCWIPQGQFALFADGRQDAFLSYNDDTGYFCFDNIEIITGQFTGISDRSGKHIYEGDFVYLAGTGIELIEWPFIDLYEAASENDIGYIKGNIHENPELLEK